MLQLNKESRQSIWGKKKKNALQNSQKCRVPVHGTGPMTMETTIYYDR